MAESAGAGADVVGTTAPPPPPVPPNAEAAEWLGDLVEAARYGDCSEAEIKESLGVLREMGCSLDCADAQGRHAVHVAAANGHEGVLRQLLAAGASPDVRNVRSSTALHWAALNDHVGCAAALLEAGAAVTTINAFDRSPLDEALARLGEGYDPGHPSPMVALLKQASLGQHNAMGDAEVGTDVDDADVTVVRMGQQMAGDGDTLEDDLVAQ